jgi:hypothetical protein
MTTTLKRSTDLLEALKQNYQDKDFMHQVLSNSLYYQGGVEFRELCTQAAWDTGLSSSRLVKEHPWGRKRSIEILDKLVEDNPNITPEEFDKHVRKYLKFRITTKTENEDLKKYYIMYPDAHPDEAYSKVCSPLREWVNVRYR